MLKKQIKLVNRSYVLYRCKICEHGIRPTAEAANEKNQEAAVISNSWEKYDENISYGWRDRPTELKQYTTLFFEVGV